MPLDWLVERIGEGPAAALGALVLGVVFGFAAERSRFCLRAAVLDFVRGDFGRRLAVWLLAFSTAVLMTQAALALGLLGTSGIRQLTSRISLSGAIIGGALFGAGMVLARGCASRLLVLCATGNLRSLLSGLVFAVSAQAALRGILSPLRDRLAALWTVDDPGVMDAAAALGLDRSGSALVGLLWLAAGLLFAVRSRLSATEWLGAVGVGATVAAGWVFTDSLAAASFDPTPVRSLSFTGPSANTLMFVLSPPGRGLEFDTALVPGVFLGALLGGLVGGDLKLEGFRDGQSMRRSIAGAVMMGFGGMLAGGCAVGAGVSGAAVFATVAWVTLLAMWTGAAVADRLVDRTPAPLPGPGAVLS
ncbi:YeeE/YedE family protein [Prosthecomicrobium sp. N25]|uniref:YeeE/YedE family protein n=1 Tax=Prosthecomicrobium sp. N25 TaxID=3129254 RepID=UPI0030773725